MNIVFMGTPDFAVPCLEALVESGEMVSAVFTQPDKPKGRGYKLTPSPVKEKALSYNIPVYQPQSLKKGEDGEAAEKVLKEIAPELIIVVAYGKILPKAILDIPKYCINVHASLLPKYRGAAPIQRSVLNGEKVTGVTTMLMAEELDAGDILLSRSTEIGENETAAELWDRLSEMGAEMLLETVKAVKADNITPIKQDGSLSNYAPMITKDMCPIDFSKTAQEVHNHIRGLSSFPCATAVLGDKRLKIFKSELTGDKVTDKQAGTVVNVKDFTVVCGDGNCVRFTEIQADGGKRMKTADYLRGKPIAEGTILK
ncbi:MAG: methionyl-tRNA formyltransferase [Ruminococcus sp.]|nr:methionyl-tRNA formyltransferase [Ruminococcus sp.]MCM1478542.1 methionyl-tRNA formyltransferase [Muribaculaceae bacterium]